MPSRCFVRGTCLNLSPRKGDIYMFSAATGSPCPYPPSCSPGNGNKPAKTVKAKGFIIGTYSVRLPHRSKTRGPSGFSRRSWGLSTNWYPHSPGRCSSLKHAGRGLPLNPPLIKWHLQLEGGEERKTVLSFDVPPIKSLRGCGAGGEGVDVLQK